jgi:hypothetical protein
MSRPIRRISRTVSDGSAERDAAIAQVTENADAEWIEAACAATARLARTRVDLTTDDIWEALDGWRPREPRAMGAVTRWAKNTGLIAATPDFRRSERAVAHRNPKQVWLSRVFSTAGAPREPEEEPSPGSPAVRLHRRSTRRKSAP